MRAPTSCSPDHQEKTASVVAPWAATEASRSGVKTSPRSRFFDGHRSESLTPKDGLRSGFAGLRELAALAISAASWPALPD